MRWWRIDGWADGWVGGWVESKDGWVDETIQG